MNKMTYEEAIKRLEGIVEMLEKNQVPLDESISLFQEGVELSKYCNDKLENIQTQVAQIYEDGQLKDFISEE